jgi:signal-transduction protein with cAMP-binding, CBS, and nucleotidyltransferase domain
MNALLIGRQSILFPRMNFLSQFEPFNGLSEAELENVAEHLRLRTLREWLSLLRSLCQPA